MNIFDRFWAWLLSLFGKTPTAPAGWNIQFSPGMPAQMAPLPDGTFYFDFPQVDGVHYVTKPASPISLGQTITLRFVVEGSGKLIPTQGDPPAKLRIILQQAGDRMTQTEADKRWWSDGLDLTQTEPTEHTFICRVIPDLWTNVFGKSGSENLAGFEAAVGSLGNIGFTFGGMFAGHGVFAQGPSRFVLKEFTVA